MAVNTNPARSIRTLIHRDQPFPALTSGKTAFVIIDMTYKDAHPDYGLGPKLLKAGWADIHRDYYGRVGQIIPKIQRLRDAARDAGIPVINVHVGSATADCSDFSRAFKRTGNWAPLGSKEAAILDELAPRPGEVVIAKTTGSVFNSTRIDWILRNMGIETLIVTGVVTNGCVEGSVRDAADIGYEVVLISDATTALTVEEHEDALRRLGSGSVRVRSADEIATILAAPSREPVRV
jgi:nicotinamidase-related amidase